MAVVLSLVSPSWERYEWIIDTARLYEVESFDEENRSFQYRVNQNLGQSRRGGPGFSMMLGAKYVF